MEIDALSNVLEAEKEDQLKQLNEQLSQAEENAANNKNAADILNGLLQKGEIKLEDDGSVSVVRVPNTISNDHELDE